MSDEQSSSRVANPSPSDLEHDRFLLSNREAEVVRRTRTKSYATVADELGISESTVGTYRTRATNRLNEQLKIIRRMIRQQQADKRDESIKEIAREAVEALRGSGVEVEFEIEPEPDEDTGSSAEEATSTQQSKSATATVDMTQGELGDNHHTERNEKRRRREPVRTESDYKENLMYRGE